MGQRIVLRDLNNRRYSYSLYKGKCLKYAWAMNWYQLYSGVVGTQRHKNHSYIYMDVTNKGIRKISSTLDKLW